MHRPRVSSETDPLLGSTSARPLRTAYNADEPSLHKPRLRGGGPHCCTTCCSFLAPVCCVYLIWVAIYASLGWNYQHNGWTKHQVATVQGNALLAACMWGATGILAIYMHRTALLRAKELEPETVIVREHHD